MEALDVGRTTQISLWDECPKNFDTQISHLKYILFFLSRRLKVDYNSADKRLFGQVCILDMSFSYMKFL